MDGFTAAFCTERAALPTRTFTRGTSDREARNVRLRLRRQVDRAMTRDKEPWRAALVQNQVVMIPPRVKAIDEELRSTDPTPGSCSGMASATSTSKPHCPRPGTSGRDPRAPPDCHRYSQAKQSVSGTRRTWSLPATQTTFVGTHCGHYRRRRYSGGGEAFRQSGDVPIGPVATARARAAEDGERPDWLSVSARRTSGGLIC
jgi:hypothetical protein